MFRQSADATTRADEGSVSWRGTTRDVTTGALARVLATQATLAQSPAVMALVRHRLREALRLQGGAFTPGVAPVLPVMALLVVTTVLTRQATSLGATSR